MSLKCPNCGCKINADWVIFSSAGAKYRCLDCCALLGWNTQYRRAYPAAVLVLVAVLIAVKSMLVDGGLVVEVDFVQNIFVLAGMLFFVLLLKLVIPLQTFLTVIEPGKKRQ